LALLVCVQCAGQVLSAMADCEERWGALEASFDNWRKERGQREDDVDGTGLDELPRLLSVDGPWRGNFEDASRFSRQRSALASSQAATLAVALCAGCFGLEVCSTSRAPPSDAMLGCTVAWGCALAVVWAAAALTDRMHYQDAHLYELYKLAVERLTPHHRRGGKCAEMARAAQAAFCLEYGLVKEFVSLSQLRSGFALLGCRITRTHALSITGVLSSTLVNRWSACSTISGGLSTLLMLAAAAVTLATDARLTTSRSMHLSMLVDSGYALQRLTRACCTQKTLVAVVAVLVARALQCLR